MDLELSGRRAAVAAASSGLGFAVAAALAAEGAEVVICGSDRRRIERAAQAIEGAVEPVVADVATTNGAVAFVEWAEATLGALDILIANGPGPRPGTFESTSVEDLREAAESTLLPAAAMCHRVVPGMRERGWGRIVAITSIAVRQPIPTLLLSNAARTGLTSFLKTLALEIAADGVTVNSVQPGLHATRRLVEVYGDALPAELERVPARRAGDVEAFGRFVAFLCSPHASYLTGAAIPLDGGAYRGLQ